MQRYFMLLAHYADGKFLSLFYVGQIAFRHRPNCRAFYDVPASPLQKLGFPCRSALLRCDYYNLEFSVEVILFKYLLLYCMGGIAFIAIPPTQ